MLGWLADAYWRTGDLVKARDALDQALALSPRDPALRRLRQTIR
jgi:Flp pilus assembly protein TadD